jgi:glutathione S-transferase
MTYKLWYWTGIPGRGEFVRLALEAAGVPYRDMAREFGDQALIEDMGLRSGFAPFAPPYLLDENDFCIAQVAHILAWLSDKHGFGAGDLPTDLHLIQLQLTISDLVAEVHATHHPLAIGLTYEQQKAAAAENAKHFRKERIPKFLDHFETALAVAPGSFLLGDKWTHVDTSLYQLLEGLRYAFPTRMEHLEEEYPRLFQVHEAVARLGGIAAYLESDRRLPFNEDGIFRHYPELDGA